MATVAGDSCIWRATDPQSGSEAAAGSDKIEFNLGAVPDANGNMSETDVFMDRVLSENPKPKQNDPNELQDNGLAGVTYKITGFISDPINAAVQAKLRDWLRENQTDNKFVYGRFGIRMNDNPAFKVTPNTTYGLMFEDFRFVKIGEWQYRAGFIATLRYNGTITGLGL